MRFSLISEDNLKIFNIRYKLTNWFGVGLFILLLILSISSIFNGTFNIWYYLSVSLLFGMFYLYLWIRPARHRKVMRSHIELTETAIKVFYESGDFWREIPYNTITEIRAEIIEGWFYGPRRDEVKYKYVCLFINGNKEIPTDSYRDIYKKMYHQENFFMIMYSDELFEELKKRVA